jgi:serine/threonine protein kinase
MNNLFAKMQTMNYLHRDIKPDNILVKYEQSRKIYKVCDFGYSTKKNEYSGHNITGTIQYASPRVK